MEIQADASALSAGGSALIEISNALVEPAAHCERALESAARAMHDRALSSVIVEISGLAAQAHRRLAALVAGVGTRTAHAGNSYDAAEGRVARSAGQG
jgi:hypothetical protein